MLLRISIAGITEVTLVESQEKNRVAVLYFCSNDMSVRLRQVLTGTYLENGYKFCNDVPLLSIKLKLPEGFHGLIRLLCYQWAHST